MKRMHKLLCLLCALVLVFGVLSTGALAANLGTESITTEDNYYPFIFSNGDGFAWARNIIGDCSDCVEGYLYVQDLNSKEIWRILDQPVSMFRTQSTVMYCVVDGTAIIKTDFFGQNPTEIYTADFGYIENLEFYGDDLYFTDGNYVVRMNTTDGTTNTIAFCEGISFLFPVSSNSFAWMGEGTNTYLYNTETKEQTLVELKELLAETATDDAAPVLANASPFAIQFESSQEVFPFSDYPHGSHFTYNGAACSNHDNCSYGGCNCYCYRKSIQCMGFAKYAYDRYAHTITSDVTWYPSNTDPHVTTKIELNTDQDVQLLFREREYGSYLRLARRNGDRTNGNHSVVTAGVSSSGVTIYDANDSKTDLCVVQLRTFTFARFRTLFDYVTRAISHDFNGLVVKNNANVHAITCSYSGCSGYILAAHYSSNPGTNATCDACGYVGNIQIGLTSIGGSDVDA